LQEANDRKANPLFSGSQALVVQGFSLPDNGRRITLKSESASFGHWEYVMRCPFYLQRKQTGKSLVWYARFWDEKLKKYTFALSTGIIAEGKRNGGVKPN
jgi:hypothetical protein